MFNRAIALVEGDPEAVDEDSLAVLYTERGKVQAAMDNPDEAFVSYRKAESLNPDYIGLQVALGAYYYSLRDWDSARRYFRQAAQQQEPLPAIAYGLGLLEFYAGEYAAAVPHFQEAVNLTEALDEEPILPWLALGYAYSELGDCVASDAAFAAIMSSETAEDDIRAAAEVETGRCDRAKVAAVATPTTPAGGAPAGAVAATTPLVTAEATAPPVVATICALAGTELRAGPGVEFAAAARLEAGGAATWGGAREGNWLRVSLAPGFEVWASAFDFAPCAGGAPWAATGTPPVVWPTSLPPPATLLATADALVPTLIATLLASPPATPRATINNNITGDEPSPTVTLLPSPTLLATPLPPTLLPEPTSYPPPLPAPTETLLPPPPATPTARPSPTETLLPEPSETFIPSGTGEPTAEG